MVRHRNVLFMVVACLLIVIVGVSSYVSSQHGDSHLEAIMYIDAASMQLVVEGNSDDVNVSYENVCVRYGQNNTCEEYVREYMLEDLSGNILRMRIDYKEFTNSVEMKVLSFDRGIWIVRPNINYLRFTKTPDGDVQELVVDKVKQVTVTYDEANRQSQIHMWHDNTPGGKLVDGASTLRMKTSLNTLTFDILDELPPVKGLSYLMRIQNKAKISRF